MGENATTAGITLVVIDDHPVVHSGLTRWSAERSQAQYTVRAYRSVAQFVADTHRHHHSTVIVYDPKSGTQRPDFCALNQLCSSYGPVIVYSCTFSPEIVLACLDAGAATYLVKSEPPQHLLHAIEAVAAGNKYRGPTVAAALRHAQQYGRARLTRQERRVLEVWLRTENKESVARQLHISPSTVRTHLHRIRRRYEAAGRPSPNKAVLFARAVQDGLLGIHDL